MNLREWIANDHASVAARFSNSIEQYVPADRWKTPAPGPTNAPAGSAGSSIEFLVFHTTYHQDLALNTAVRNHPPLLDQHRSALGIDAFDPAVGLSEAENHSLTEALDHDALLRYMAAVNGSVAGWIHDLSELALDSIPSAGYRLEHIAGLSPDGPLSWLHSMWNGKTVAWFVQWECIGHRHTHVGEMTAIRNRMGLSPF